MKPLIKDLVNIVNGNFDAVDKSIGVLLHDNGFIRYNGLTAENYNYWWYACDDALNANPRHFTY
jgi:hypothetical protein